MNSSKSNLMLGCDYNSRKKKIEMIDLTATFDSTYQSVK